MSSVSFETGHVYGCDRMYPFQVPGNLGSSDFTSPLDLNFEFEMRKGLEIQEFLENELGGCQRIWFHDDIIPRQKQNSSQDAWRWQHLMNVTKQQVLDRLAYDGVRKIQVQNEFDLISQAKNYSIPSIISAMQGNNIWRYDQERKILRGPKKNRKQQRIRLYGYGSYDDIPSCEILDYTFYCKRLEQASPTVTLIHESMFSQQERVRQLFSFQGMNPEVIVLFHNGESITSSVYWGMGENRNLQQKLEAF